MASVESLGGIAAVHIIIKAVDKATKVIYEVIAALMTLQGIMAIAGVALGGYLAVKGVQNWMSYEDALVRVQKTTNMTSKQIEALDQRLRDMAIASRLGLEELANIAAIAGQLGFRGKDIIQFTDLVKRSMIAWETSAEDTALALGHIRNAYKLTTDEMEVMAASINALENRFGATAGDIVQVTEDAAESAALFGVSAEQIAAMGATVLQTGVSVSRTGTSIRRMFEFMADNGDEMAAAMGMSFEDFKNAVNENAFEVINTFAEMAYQTEDKFGLMILLNDIFGKKGSAAIKKLSFATDEYNRALGVIGEEALNVAEFNGEYEMANNTLAASFAKLSSALEILTLDFGTALAPQLEWIVNLITDNIDAVTKIIKLFVTWAGVYLMLILLTKLHIKEKLLFLVLTKTEIGLKLANMKATGGLTMAMVTSRAAMVALMGVGMMAFGIFAMLGGKLDWLSGVIIMVTIAMAIMKAVMGDLAAAARGLAAAAMMIGLSMMWEQQMAELDTSIEGLGDVMPTGELDANTEALIANTEVVDKVNAKDMAVSIPIVINFGSEISGMSRDEFETYATNIINRALIDGLRDAGMLQLGG